MPGEVDPSERARIEAALDRVEGRLHDASLGLHAAGLPADVDTLASAGLPGSERAFWARHDGIDIGHGEGRVFPLAEIGAETAAASEAGVVHSGDLVVAERGRDLFVLPEDPYEEGASVVLVDEVGDRSPEASSVAHLALGLMAEADVLIGEEGEFRDELFGDDGELLERVERRLLRRRLDVDPDAPRPRYRLAVLLRRGGEARAAVAELRKTLVRAPQFAWAHHELCRAWLDLDGREAACQAALAAGDNTDDPDLRAYFLSWAACAADGSGRERIAATVLQTAPGFVATRVAAARDLLERDDLKAAHEVINLALCVAPSNLELLELRRRLPG